MTTHIDCLPSQIWNIIAVYSRPIDYMEREVMIKDQLFDLEYVSEVNDGCDISVTVKIKRINPRSGVERVFWTLGGLEIALDRIDTIIKGE